MLYKYSNININEYYNNDTEYLKLFYKIILKIV